jgi:hypothetical protein
MDDAEQQEEAPMIIQQTREHNGHKHNGADGPCSEYFFI